MATWQETWSPGPVGGPDLLPAAGSRRRRSWFTPGKSPVAYQLAVQTTTPPDPDPTPSFGDMDDDNVDTLTLSHFTRAPRVDFGTLRPNRSGEQRMRVVNPHHYTQNVVVAKFPYKQNFSISRREFAVPGEAAVMLVLAWNPTEPGSYREMVTFKVDDVFKLQATLLGRLEEPPKPKKVRKTWAKKPALPVRGVLRTSNRINTQNTLQSKGTKRSPPTRSAPKRKSPVRKAGGPALIRVIPTTSTNPRHPQGGGPLFDCKGHTEPLESPDSRHKTFEKSFPEMYNTPVIRVTPPQSRHQQMLQQSRIAGTPRARSPLATVCNDQENMPPLLFAGDSNQLQTPRQPWAKAKTTLRRSNTYTKLNDSGSKGQAMSDLQSPTDSTSTVSGSSADTTVVERTEVTEYVEVVEEVIEYKTTEVCEEVIEYEETVDYLIEGSDGKQTEIARSVRPLRSQMFIQDSAESTYRVHHETLSSTRLLTPGQSDDTYISDSGTGLSAPWHCATFVKSPLAAAPGVLSETRVLSPQVAPSRVLSETRVLSPLVAPSRVLSETRVLTPHHDVTPIRQVLTPPPPASPRRFFSGLLALHDGKQEHVGIQEQPQQDQDQGQGERLQQASPAKASFANRPQSDAVWTGDMGNEVPAQADVDPRRFSTLTITKDSGSSQFTHAGNGVRNIAHAFPSPRASPGKDDLFQFATSSQSLNASYSPSGVFPLLSSPSPSPGQRSMNKINIHGTNYPNSRSPRNLEANGSVRRSPSPRKSTPKSRAKTRRRTSGQFKRHSATFQLSNSQAARRPHQQEVGLSDCGDLPMSSSELSNDYTNDTDGLLLQTPCKRQARIKSFARPANSHWTPAPSQLRMSVSDQSQSQNDDYLRASSPMTLTDLEVSVKSVSTQAGQHPVINVEGQVRRRLGVPNYSCSTSPAQRRKEVVTETKKRNNSADSRRSGRIEKLHVPKQEPAPKKPKHEFATSLTRTKTLPREVAFASMSKAEKKPVPRPKLKVAQPKLCLVRATTKTALPKHPMAFAAKNIYYDERWMEKQDRGFVRWLNFVLTPHEEECNGPKKPQKIDAGVLVVSSISQSGPQLAPTRETLSFRVYSARRRLNRLRRAACRLFTSDTMVRFHHKLEVEVECGRILVRSDRKMHADVGIKQSILDLILSYNPLWLRIGLEAVFGEVLPVTSNVDIIGISRFILTRLLGNPDIAAEFVHPTVPHLYREGYDKRLAQFSLKTFVLLIVFLDCAKSSRLIDHDPCLFCRDSDYKASRDVLLAFSRDYLSGEGDLSRHLSHMGYTVSHVQVPLDELDYAVTNLAVDLRDGTRLTRVVAMLTEKWSLTNELRVPAISRLQKVYNIGVAFSELKAAGLELTTVKGGKIDPRDISDGHREKTLNLLWQLIFKFQVILLLDEAQLREEISFLRANLSIKRQFDAVCNDDITLIDVPKKHDESEDVDLYFKSPRLSLLLAWCRSVCGYYGVKVENFTVSFSDGRVLCYLIHHYHPGLLPQTDIHNETTQTMGPGEHNASLSDSSSDDSFNAPWTTSISPTTGKPAFWDELLANERENFRMVYEKVNELGNIPVMVRASDMSNTIPDEKVVITYVTYLCARLLDIRHETRAARIIQVAWRRHRLRKQEGQLQVRLRAAVKMQHVVRSFLEKRRQARWLEAAITIQAGLRGMLARRRAAGLWLQRHMLHKNAAIITVQAYIRSWLVRRTLQRQKLAAVRIQAWWRMTSARRSFVQHSSAAIIIQRYYRAHQEAVCSRVRYLVLRTTTVYLQGHIRSWLARRRLQREQASAVRVQAWWRMVRCRQELRRRCKAAIIIQRWLRAESVGKHDRAHYVALKAATLLLQRAFIAKRLGLSVRQYKAATTIQKQWRAYMTTRRYKLMNSAAVCIQRWFHLHRDQRSFRRSRNATICIQRYVRGWLLRTRVLKEHHAVVALQAWWRSKSTRRAFLIRRQASVTVQRFVRAWRQARRMRAAVTIQAAWRACTARKRFEHVKHATHVIQRTVRAARQRHCFSQQRRAALCIQACARGQQERDLLTRRAVAAITIQSWWAMVKVQRLYVIQRAAAITLQEHYRAHCAAQRERTRYHRMRAAAVTVQAHWKARMARRNFRRQQRAAITIQRAVRTRLRRHAFCRLRAAAVCVQRGVRAWLMRRTLCCQVVSAITVQSWWRMHAARHAFLQARTAAVTLQRHFRVAQKRKWAAAVTLQAWWRMTACRRTYQKQRAAACVIQRHYCAAQQGRRQLRQYQVARRAVVTLQRAWRAYHARCCYLRTRQAALTVQRWYRARQVRVRYLHLRRAAMCLQQRVRAVMASRRYRQRYLAARAACVRLQAAFRGWRQRRRFAAQRAAATRLQAAWRGFSRRRQFLRRKRAAVVIQTRLRAALTARRLAAVYSARQRAATHMQVVWHGLLARRRYLQLRRAVVVLQAHARRRLARRRFCVTRAAAVCVQRRFRARILGRRDQRAFFITLGAIITLQAALRGWALRRRLGMKRMRDAARTIQAAVRGFLARRLFVRWRVAVVRLQRHVRGWLEARRQYCKYHITRGACLIIQAHVRAWLQRRRYSRIRTAAVTLQAHFRGALQRRHYALLRAAAVRIQCQYRAQRQLRNFRLKRQAAVVIQACVRGHLVRRSWKKQMKAVVVIQSAHRLTVARRRFSRMKTAARTIQSFYRGHILCKKTRRDFLVQRRAAVVIQSARRGFIERRRVAIWHHSATVIQAAYRAHCTRGRFLRLKAAVFIVQTYRHSQLICRHDRKRFLNHKSAAITIQSGFRSYTVRKKVVKLHRSATIIQAMYRTHIARRRFMRLKAAVVIIQTYRCRQLMERKKRKQLTLRHHSATVIQAAFHAFSLRRRFLRLKTAVLKIQTYRHRQLICRREQRQFQIQKRAAITIQSVFRRFIVKRRVALYRRSATVIQAAFRAHITRRQYIRLKAAALIIQTYLRGHLVRRQYVIQKNAAVIIQSAYRGFAARQLVASKHRWATIIQTLYRTRLARRRFQWLKAAAGIIQTHRRRQLIARENRSSFLIQKHAAVIIQSVVRGFTERRRVALWHCSATVIQAAYRAHSTRRRFMRLKAAVFIIQTYRRSQLICRQERGLFISQKRAAITIQSVFRGLRVRADLRKQTEAAIVIQSVVRGHVARQGIIQKKKTLITMRKVYIQKLSVVTRSYLAVVRIQRVYRKHVALKEAKAQLPSVLLIQGWMRSRLVRLHYLRLQEKTIVIQRLARAYLARRQTSITKLQALVRGWLVRRRYVKMLKGFIRTQALWRAYRVRCQVRNVKVKAARRRVEAANANATVENQLGNLTTSALDYLLRCQQLSTILDALMKLDMATRWSPACCELMAQSNASGVIFALIRSCNRSAPHMEIIKYSIEVLLNLTKYEKTCKCVFEAADSVPTLIQLLTIFREKGCIFTKSCTLLGLMCYPAVHRKAVHVMPQVLDKVRSVHALTLRKYKMEEKRKLARTKMAAAKSFNASFLGTSMSIGRPLLPRIEPEWLLRRQSMREITDPIQATKFLMNALHISPK